VIVTDPAKPMEPVLQVTLKLPAYPPVIAFNVTVLVVSVAVALALAPVRLAKHGATAHCDELLLIAARRFSAKSVLLTVLLPLVTSKIESGMEPRVVTNVYVVPPTVIPAPDQAVAGVPLTTIVQTALVELELTAVVQLAGLPPAQRVLPVGDK
jgi:hypothetical protein